MVGVSSRQFLFNLPYLHQALDKICITPQQQQTRGKHIAPNWEQKTIEAFHITERIFWRMAIVGIGSHLLCCVTTSKLSIGRGVNIIYHLLSDCLDAGP